MSKMTLVIERQGTPTFEELTVGDLFMLNGAVYLKTMVTKVQGEYSTLEANAVVVKENNGSSKTGLYTYVRGNIEVLPVRTTTLLF